MEIIAHKQYSAWGSGFADIADFGRKMKVR